MMAGIMATQILKALLIVLALFQLAPAQASTAANSLTEPSAHLTDFQVIELRRYTVKDGARKNFAQYFEAYFPEAIEQTGAIVAGSFFERNHPNGFTWIRGFHTLEDRPVADAEFYYGPVWREHRKTMNDLLTDSDNVLQLRPLSPGREITILPAVDPLVEPDGARGIIVAFIYPIKANSVEAFAKQAESTFARYQAAGAREAGVLVTLDATNNFPQLPIRTDGPYLVWLGLLRDNQTLERELTPVVENSISSLTATGLLRGAPEFIVLDPTPRSRLRWLPQ
jgi:hypothetical protein